MWLKIIREFLKMITTCDINLIFTIIIMADSYSVNKSINENRNMLKSEDYGFPREQFGTDKMWNIIIYKKKKSKIKTKKNREKWERVSWWRRRKEAEMFPPDSLEWTDWQWWGGWGGEDVEMDRKMLEVMVAMVIIISSRQHTLKTTINDYVSLHTFTLWTMF